LFLWVVDKKSRKVPALFLLFLLVSREGSEENKDWGARPPSGAVDDALVVNTDA
jgi:hypothetical protein